MKKPLWEPSAERKKQANMTRFIQFVNRKFEKDFKDYPELYEWSIQEIPDFWAAFWEFAGIRASRGYDRVVDDLGRMPGAKWFEGARLNFAENLLRYRDDRPALDFQGRGSGTAPAHLLRVVFPGGGLGQVSAPAGYSTRGPGGGLHAQHDGNHHRHAGGHQPGCGLVFLLPGFWNQGGPGPFRPDRTQGPVHRQRVFLQRQVL